jgi:cyclase
MARHIGRWILAVGSGALLCLAAPATARQASGELAVLRVQGFEQTMIYMIVGAGANITAQVGNDGVVLVDTGTAQNSDKVLAALRTITDKPVRYIINTHAHPDHAGGNVGIVKAIGGQRTSQGGGGGGVENPTGVQVYSHQKAADRLLDDPVYIDDAIPKFTFLTADKQLFLNDEAIELWYHPNAHTDGDILIYFRRSDVIVAGDLLHTDTYPIFDAAWGGRLQGMLNGLNQIIDIAVPRFNQMDGTRIIPGHGRLCTESDIAELRDMATIVRDRVNHMISKGMTLEQVKAARPTIDYNPVYGSTTGSWTTDKFIETVYADLKKPQTGPAPKSGLNFSDGGR